MLNKCLFIQIWAEQKHPKPDPAAQKISTKEYFEREKEISSRNLVMGKEILNNAVDPEKQRLRDDLNIALINERKNQFIITNVFRLLQVTGQNPINPQVLGQLVCAKDEQEVQKILAQLHAQNQNSNYFFLNHTQNIETY